MLSVATLSAGLAALGHYLARSTGSVAAAVAAPALILLNPNVLYIQSTPMTEPMLFALSLLSLAFVDAWALNPTRGNRLRAGWAIAALTLTRYEGWVIALALIGLSAVWRRGRQALALLPYWLWAVAAFLVLARASTGQWLVASGFFVADNPVRHRLFATLDDVLASTRELGGDVLLAAALAGAAACLIRARDSLRALLPLALVAAALLPAAAFYQGHPHRIRYMLPLVAASGVLAAFGLAELPRRIRGLAAVALVAAALYTRPPFDRTAPMVLEAQWETPFRVGREAVSRYLDEGYDGTPILASMGSLGHYMQEASRHGLGIANFVHEGNGDLWTAAIAGPGHYVNWILIEEQAEGGDVLATRARGDSTFLAGFSRVADGGGVALYKFEGRSQK